MQHEGLNADQTESCSLRDGTTAHKTVDPETDLPKSAGLGGWMRADLVTSPHGEDDPQTYVRIRMQVPAANGLPEVDADLTLSLEETNSAAELLRALVVAGAVGQIASLPADAVIPVGPTAEEAIARGYL